MSRVIPTGEQKAANKHLLLPTATGGAAGPTSPFPEQQKKAGLNKCTGAGLNIGLCSKRLAGENKKEAAIRERASFCLPTGGYNMQYFKTVSRSPFVGKFTETAHYLRWKAQQFLVKLPSYFRTAQ